MLLLKNEWQQKKKLVLNINAKEIFYYGRFQGKGIFFLLLLIPGFYMVDKRKSENKYG